MPENSLMEDARAIYYRIQRLLHLNPCIFLPLTCRILRDFAFIRTIRLSKFFSSLTNSIRKCARKNMWRC